MEEGRQEDSFWNYQVKQFKKNSARKNNEDD